MVTNLVDELAQHVVALGECDGYLVLVADPVTGDVDAYGPFSGQAAALDADRRRDELDIEGLLEVAVRLVAISSPAEQGRLAHHSELGCACRRRNTAEMGADTADC